MGGPGRGRGGWTFKVLTVREARRLSGAALGGWGGEQTANRGWGLRVTAVVPASVYHSALRTSQFAWAKSPQVSQAAAWRRKGVGVVLGGVEWQNRPPSCANFCVIFR